VNKAAFLDRDGVINRKAPEGRYVTSIEKFEFLPGTARAIACLNRAGFKVIVITNQRCVAKGLITVHALNLLHQWMCRKLEASGAVVDAIYYCPHDKQPACSCRKPAPGMLFAAAKKHHIDLASSWMIGDSDSDVEAGRNAGCKTARLGGDGAPGTDGKADLSARSLSHAVGQILAPRAGTRNRSTRRPLLDYGKSAGIAARADRR
jgi:D-glycero-D-manno-heptose 1,7-bisphosphate phosphatase